jgi:hypothetical protein
MPWRAESSAIKTRAFIQCNIKKAHCNKSTKFQTNQNSDFLNMQVIYLEIVMGLETK